MSDSGIEDGIPFHFTREDAKLIYSLGERLVLHDKFDVGSFAYRHRPHLWNGKMEKRHMSAVHHWIPGFGMLIIGQLLGAAAEIKETYEQINPPAKNKDGTDKEDDSFFEDLLNIY